MSEPETPTGWQPTGGPPPPSGWAAPAGPTVPSPQPPAPGYGAYGPPDAGSAPLPGGYGPPPGAVAPPGPGYAPPGYGTVYAPPAPAQPKKRRGWLIALAVIGAMLVLGVGGCAAAIAFGVKTLTAPVDASNRWLEAIDRGSATSPQLVELTCPSLRSELGRLKAGLDQMGWSGQKNLNQSNIVNSSATVSGTLTVRRGTTQISINLDREDDAGYKGWCVNGVHVDAI